MKLSSRRPREAISEAVIAAVVTEARETGRPQVVADSQCTALRLVVTPLADPRWLFFCYNKDGRLEKSSLGRYPRVGVEEAREKAWRLRLQVKGISGRRSGAPDITLERLLMLYEHSRTTSIYWGRQKDKVVYVFKPFLFHSFAAIDLRKLQKYIDNYPSPGAMRSALRQVKTIVTWGKGSGIINISMNTLTPPKARSRSDAGRRRDLPALPPAG
jgi:hypothetical protein